MQGSQPQNTEANTNSPGFRLVLKSLQILAKYEENEERKKIVERVLSRVIQLKNSSLIKELDHQFQKKMFDIKTTLKFYIRAFGQATNQQQFKQFKMLDKQITDVLLNIQEKIDYRDFKKSYSIALAVKKKDFGWSKQFIAEWIRLAEEERKKQQQKVRQRQAQKSRQIKSQSLPQLNSQIGSQSMPNSAPLQQQTALGNPPKLQQKKSTAKGNQKSSQKLPGQKPEKKIKKEQASQKPQKQNKATKKKDAYQSQSSDNQGEKQAKKKKQQKQAKQKVQRYQKARQPKNRVKAFMEYLASRKEFSSWTSNQSKLKEMAELLNQNLEKFMKHHLSNLIEIAKLRNRKHQTLPSSGNEFTYFSKQGYAPAKPISQLQVSQQPAKMLKLNYRSKFELYTILRSQQQKLEESLLKMYAAKKQAQNGKTSDKKLWEYLLRPNHITEKTENFIQMEQPATDRLSIELCHVRYLFQSHKFIKNSWLMMYCYNS